MEKDKKSKSSKPKTDDEAESPVDGEIELGNIQDGISNIFNREVKELPIPADIPRLYKGLKIVVNGALVYVENGGEERLAAVREIFKQLAANLQDPDSATFVNESFDKVVNGDLDLPTQLGELLQPANPSLKLIRVLKLVHQKVMFPVVREMKKMGKDFQYKDVKGTWVVRIVFTKKHVTVFHEKKERAYDEKSFFFDWRLGLTLDLKTCSKLQAKAEIISFEFPTTTAPELKSRFLAAAAPFLSPFAEYNSIWRKPIASLAVHKDVARLAKHMQVFRNDGKQLFERKEDPAESAKVFLKTMVELLDPALKDSVSADIDKFIKADGDLVTQIETLLKQINENVRFVRLLKLLAHNIVSPVVMKLRGRLYEKLPYKDVAGTYRIHITFTVNDKKGWKSITVTHRKREQAHSDSSSVQFEWISSLTVNANVDELLSVDVAVVDVAFGESVSPDIRKMVSETLAPFKKDKESAAPGNIVSSISSQELLHAVIGCLREKKLGDLSVFSASLPYSLSVIELLEQYEASLDPKTSTSILIQK